MHLLHKQIRFGSEGFPEHSCRTDLCVLPKECKKVCPLLRPVMEHQTKIVCIDCERTTADVHSCDPSLLLRFLAVFPTPVFQRAKEADFLWSGCPTLPRHSFTLHMHEIITMFLGSLFLFQEQQSDTFGAIFSSTFRLITFFGQEINGLNNGLNCLKWRSAGKDKKLGCNAEFVTKIARLIRMFFVRDQLFQWEVNSQLVSWQVWNDNR